MLGAGTTTWASVGDTSLIGKAAQNPSTNWASIIAGSNDDAQVRERALSMGVPPMTVIFSGSY